jgi:DNA-binding transcriptional regulator YiaG
MGDEIKKRDVDYIVKTNFGELLVELRTSTGLNRKVFAEYFKIPYRTMQDWELGNNPMPEYVYRLIEYQVKCDEYFKSKKEK